MSDASPPGLPRSAVLTCWLAARLVGRVSPDSFVEAVTGDDPHHLVVGLGPEPVSLVLALGHLGAGGASGARLALPVPGDPLGLAGPAGVNAAALIAGEAVLVPGTGLALVPQEDARTVLWQASPALVPAPLDPAEEGRLLRRSLLESTRALVDLDVASWQPEIPDLLANLRHRPALPLPPRTPPLLVEIIERATLCRDVVALAREDDGGAVSAQEARRRREALDGLERAARRALVAACGAADSLR